MAYRGLYQLLLDALEDSRPGMAPDDPAEIARRYPQNGATDSPHAEAQSRFPPVSNSPPRDPNFRQLSRAPFAAEAQASDGSNARSNPPAYLWTAPPQNAGSFGAHGDRPTLPWWAPPLPPMLPVPGGRFLPRPSGPVSPGPVLSTGSTGPSKIPMPPLAEAWNVWGTTLGLLPGLVLERFSSSGRGGDDQSRCTQAAEGSYEDWMAFCDSLLQRVRGNTVGSETVMRACRSKGPESVTNKKNWCDNQFGKGL